MYIGVKISYNCLTLIISDQSGTDEWENFCKVLSLLFHYTD